MKVKITHPIRDGETVLYPGTVCEVANKKAQEWLAKEWAIEWPDEEEFEVEVKRGKKPAKEL